MTRPSRRGGEFALPARALVLVSSCAVLGMPLLAGCTENTSAGNAGAAASENPRALTVQATDAECKLSATNAPSGALTFAVTNGGSKPTEFYLYGEDGKRIIYWNRLRQFEVTSIPPSLQPVVAIDRSPAV